MPVATERLLYVPMPFAGDVWVTNIMQSAGSVDVPRLDKVCSVGDIPASWRVNRVVFGTISDPWSWYQGLWEALTADQTLHVLLRQLGRGSVSFPAFIRGVTDPTIWMDAPNRLTSTLWDWPAGTEDGLYSATVKALYDHPTSALDALIDHSQIEEGMSQILGTTLKSDLQHPLQHPPRWNYTISTEHLVAEADGELAETIGYDGPFSSLPRAVRWGGF